MGLRAREAALAMVARERGSPQTPPPEAIVVARPHPATLDGEELLRGCEVGTSRSSGPGGQHRNKVESRVTVRHVATGVEAHAGERRSAKENRPVAVFRLRLALATRVRTEPEALDPFGDTRSALWRARTTGEGRIVCSPRHHDYPALLAEAMDVIEASGLDPKRAAARLACSASQLIRLVKEHGPAMARWNGLRGARGLHALK